MLIKVLTLRGQQIQARRAVEGQIMCDARRQMVSLAVCGIYIYTRRTSACVLDVTAHCECICPVHLAPISLSQRGTRNPITAVKALLRRPSLMLSVRKI